MAAADKWCLSPDGLAGRKIFFLLPKSEDEHELRFGLPLNLFCLVLIVQHISDTMMAIFRLKKIKLWWFTSNN